MNLTQISHAINAQWVLIERGIYQEGRLKIDWLGYERVVRAILRTDSSILSAEQKITYIDDATAAFTGRGHENAVVS